MAYARLNKSLISSMHRTNTAIHGTCSSSALGKSRSKCLLIAKWALHKAAWLWWGTAHFAKMRHAGSRYVRHEASSGQLQIEGIKRIDFGIFGQQTVLTFSRLDAALTSSAFLLTEHWAPEFIRAQDRLFWITSSAVWIKMFERMWQDVKKRVQSLESQVIEIANTCQYQAKTGDSLSLLWTCGTADSNHTLI